jgi:molybdenum cofactor cytidylyltransferase
MPRVTHQHIDRILDAFDPAAAPIVVPTHQRKRGNPVLWARRFFPEIAALRGDVGARSLLERHAEEVCLLPIDEPGILLDVDTPQALEILRGEPSPRQRG